MLPVRAARREPATTPTSSPTTRTTRPRSPSAWSSTRASTGRATARRARRCTRPSSTRRTSRASRCCTRSVREDLRGTYAGLASDAGDRATSRSSASPRSSCCRSTTSPTSRFLHEHGPDATTGATRRSASSRRTPRYAGDRHARRAGARVQGHGQGAAPRRHRGDPRRGLQPHRRGQPPRPDALASRASTTRPTTGSCPTTRATTWTSRARATRSTSCTRASCG